MRKALIKVHVAVLLAGFTGPLGRLIHLSEGVLVWYRLLFTSVTLMTILLVRRELIRIPVRDLGRHALVGLLVAIHWTLFYGSIKYANVSIGLACFSTTSLFTSLLEPVMMKRRFEPMEVMLSLLVMAGIYVIFQFNSNYHLGIILGIISALFAASFTILTKQLTEIYPTRVVSTYMLTASFIWLSLLMPLYLHFLPQTKLIPDGTDFIYLLFLSWFCTVLAWNLSISALKKVSSFTMNLSLNLEPVYGIGLAFILFRENRELSSWFYVGLALILLSVALHMIGLMKRANNPLAPTPA